MIEVFYVTAARLGQPTEAEVHAAAIRAAATGEHIAPAANRTRSELGKFFTLADAQAHASPGPGWYDVRIETRLEEEREQHPAHAAHSVTGKPAWHREPLPAPEVVHVDTSAGSLMTAFPAAAETATSLPETEDDEGGAEET